MASKQDEMDCGTVVAQPKMGMRAATTFTTFTLHLLEPGL